MAKKNATPEVGLEGFDDLSKADFIESMTEDTGRAMSNVSSNDEGSNESTGDPEADKILNTFKKKEKASKSAKKEENEESDEEESDDEPAEKVDKKDKKGTKKEENEEEESDEDEENEEEVPNPKDKKKPADKKVKDDKKDEDSEEKETDDDKELSFDDVIDDKPAPNAEEGGGWKEVAKELFGEDDLEEDTFESFQKKFSEKADYNLAKFKPETQRLIKATEAGLSIEDFLEPLSKIDATIILPDADLVDRHLKGSGWTDDGKRQKKIEDMATSGELEVVANQARAALKEYRIEKREEIINARIKAAEKHENRLRDAYKNEAKEIGKVLKEKKEFMATPLSDANRERIIKKYEAGEYEKDFKDPQTIADFLLYKEFGKKGQDNLRTAAQKELKRKHKEKFHNLPPKSGKTGTGARATPSGQDPEGNWELLEKEKISAQTEE